MCIRGDFGSMVGNKTNEWLHPILYIEAQVIISTLLIPPFCLSFGLKVSSWQLSLHRAPLLKSTTAGTQAFPAPGPLLQESPPFYLGAPAGTVTKAHSNLKAPQKCFHIFSNQEKIPWPLSQWGKNSEYVLFLYLLILVNFFINSYNVTCLLVC